MVFGLGKFVEGFRGRGTETPAPTPEIGTPRRLRLNQDEIRDLQGGFLRKSVYDTELLLYPVGKEILLEGENSPITGKPVVYRVMTEGKWVPPKPKPFFPEEREFTEDVVVPESERSSEFDEDHRPPKAKREVQDPIITFRLIERIEQTKESKNEAA